MTIPYHADARKEAFHLLLIAQRYIKYAITL